MLKKSNIQPQPPNGSETIVVVRSANPGSIVEGLITFKKSVSAAILIARRSFVATLASAWETHRQFVVATLARALEIPARIHLLATVATFNQQSWSQSSETGAVQLSNGRQAARSSFELAKRRDLRPAFTLIELLVVMGLIGFLASMLTYALLGAQADARVARTRGTITKLNDVILAQWEEYRYRPVDMREKKITGSGEETTARLPPRDQARTRMMILRDAMRMEMPDRISDLVYGPTQYNSRVQTTINNAIVYFPAKLERGVPSRFSSVYRALQNTIDDLRRQDQPEGSPPNYPNPFLFTNPKQQRWRYFRLRDLNTIMPSGTLPPFTPVPELFIEPTEFPSPPNEPAWEGTIIEWNRSVNSSELLYQLVATSNYAGSPALENFRPSEIGDPDGDGLLEFVDAWGNPIRWIRWPAGYNSDLVRFSEPDAMDPLQTDWRYKATASKAFHPRTLVPLIYSAGPDEQFGIRSESPPFATMTFNSGGLDLTLVPEIQFYAHNSLGEYFYPDPFSTLDGQPPNGINQVGSVEDETATDNITNHDIILGL